MQYSKKLWFIVIALGAMTLRGAPASANSETAVLEVAATVPAMCKVGDPHLELDLGSAAPGEKERTGTIVVEVTCTVGTPYSITLGTGEQLSLQLSDKTNTATPIMIKTMIIGADGAAAPSKVARVGTGGADQMTIRVTAVLPDKALAGSYSQQSSFTIDW